MDEMSQDTLRFFIHTGIIFVMMMLAVLILSHVTTPFHSSTPTVQFNLIDSHHQNVTEATFSKTKHLIYLGFTNCPHICPTALTKLSDLLSANHSIAENLTPLFISVDPTQDTPDRLNGYLQAFHPKIVGLTGTEENISQLQQQLNAYSKKISTNQYNNDYTVDHSRFFYLLNEENKIIEQFSDSTDAQSMTRILSAHLPQ